MEIELNLKQIRAKIEESARKVNRDPQEIRLIAVTKYVSAEQINQALACGITDIAESRVQNALTKLPLIQTGITKHFIGTLQTNKVKPVIENFDLLHSVDRMSLVEELARQADKLGKRVPFLIQLNISGEATKHGLHPDELPGFIDNLTQYSNLEPCGLMTMAPLEKDPESVRPVFRKLKELFDKYAQRADILPKWHFLSMGMSQDYQIAIEEGSNMVRIGTAIFKS